MVVNFNTLNFNLPDTTPCTLHLFFGVTWGLRTQGPVSKQTPDHKLAATTNYSLQNNTLHFLTWEKISRNSFMLQSGTSRPLQPQFPKSIVFSVCNMRQILIPAYSGVLPCVSWMLVEALCLRSSWISRQLPLADALCSGVESSLSVALGSAPFSSSIKAIQNAHQEQKQNLSVGEE